MVFSRAFYADPHITYAMVKHLMRVSYGYSKTCLYSPHIMLDNNVREHSAFLYEHNFLIKAHIVVDSKFWEMHFYALELLDYSCNIPVISIHHVI